MDVVWVGISASKVDTRFKTFPCLTLLTMEVYSVSKIMIHWNFVIVVLLVLNSCEVIPAKRRCYSCSTLLDSDDKYDCLYNVENATDPFRFMEYCPYYCTIRRQDYADVHAGISFLNRSCEDVKLDEVDANGFYITYLRSCKSDLCNGGDGIASLKDIPEDNDDDEYEMDPESSISKAFPHVPESFTSIICIIFIVFHLIT